MNAPSMYKRKRPSCPQYKPGKHDCAYCRRDLTNEVRIRDTDIKPELEFCPECFAVGVEIGEHKKTNNYEIVDAVRVPLLSEDWAADEEARLLEALMQFGYGNWIDVSAHVGGNKTSAECERHYDRFYLSSPKFPLPDLGGTIAPAETAETAGIADEACSAAPAAAAAAPPEGAAPMLADSAEPTAGASTGGGRGGRGRGGRGSNEAAPAAAHTSTLAEDVCGYMALRAEFETEDHAGDGRQTTETSRPVTDERREGHTPY